MKINTDTLVSIKIVTLLKESGMEPLDAIMCLHGIEAVMLETVRDICNKDDDDESEDEDE